MQKKPFSSFRGNVVEIDDRNTVRYFDIRVPPEIVEPYLRALEGNVGRDVFAKIQETKSLRDGAECYHITVFRPPELEANPRLYSIVKNLIHEHQSCSVNLFGIGSVSGGENIAYYIIAQSEDINALRDDVSMLTSQQLPKINLHITLGFLHHDVHASDIPKDQSSEIIAMSA